MLIALSFRPKIANFPYVAAAFFVVFIPLLGILLGYTAIFVKVHGVRETIRRHKNQAFVAAGNSAHDHVITGPEGGVERIDTVTLRNDGQKAQADLPVNNKGQGFKSEDVRLAQTLFAAFVIFFLSW